MTIFDSGIQSTKYLSYVSTDNQRGGILAAERMGEILPGGGEIAMIGTIPGSVSTTERENGFRQTVASRFPLHADCGISIWHVRPGQGAGGGRRHSYRHTPISRASFAATSRGH